MTTVRFDRAAPALVIDGVGEAPTTALLHGMRDVIAADLSQGAEGWSARFALERSRWGGAMLPLATGRYRLELSGPVPRGELDAETLGLVRASFADGVLTLAPPVDPVYQGAEAQGALERRYLSKAIPLEDAVFFESFYGRNVSCNPRALDREIARVAPDITRYWSVADYSIEVPDGAVAIVEGSPEWWRARSVSRLLIVNDWLRRTFTRRDGQRVLQTWHGTPLKRLALHRRGFQPRRWGAILKESRRWDVLLAQNPAAGRILAAAYAYRGKPVWVEGYPRNDLLVSGDPESVRERLGIGPGDRALLYAPTWRDDRDDMVDFLDPVELAARTGAVVLVRGHSRTIAGGREAAGERVIDVTRYPDIADLLLAADALITDYSSVMFDFSVTGKPMYFFAPDLERYRGELRGFYFDLEQNAPGPLVRTIDDLVEAIAGDASVFDEVYRQWQRRFNAREDGHAAERVVARLIDQGMLPLPE